jgi:hypothetical protein
MAAQQPGPYIERSPRRPPVTRKDWLVSAALVLVCGGILVLFTDVEVNLSRWVSCGPLGSPASRASTLCR